MKRVSTSWRKGEVRAGLVARIGPKLACISVIIAAGLVAEIIASNAAASPQSSPTATEASGDIAAGRQLYRQYGCYECHGFEGQGGGSAGPRIGPDPIPLSAFLAYVRAPAREMPPYTEKVVSDKELTEIHGFLVSLPHPNSSSSKAVLD